MDFMKTLFAVITLMLLSQHCYCQVAQYGQRAISRFEIGADFVTHSTNSGFGGWSTVISADSFPTIPAWNMLREAGITLPNFHIANITPIDDITPNFPHTLIDTALKNSSGISLHVDSLMDASRWERRYYQVESDLDFSRTLVNNAAAYPNFDELTNLRFDLHPTLYNSTSSPKNGIAFNHLIHAGSKISGLKLIDELFQDSRYYITLRMKNTGDTSGLNNNNTCLHIRLHYDSTTLEWDVPSRAFVDTAMGQARVGPFEYLLGSRNTVPQPALVELHSSPIGTGYMLLRNQNDWSNEGWKKSEVTTAVTPTGYDFSDTSHFQLAITYRGNVDLFIDAVCFSDPHGYALFVGDKNKTLENKVYVDVMNKIKRTPLLFRADLLRTLEVRLSDYEAGCAATKAYLTALVKKESVEPWQQPAVGKPLGKPVKTLQFASNHHARSMKPVNNSSKNNKTECR
jgi:hypothetical protein